MKLKSLLFGSAAALMAATGAQAAEPLEPLAPIAEPVNYVRICDAFGTGFFYIPGTDTCLKIGGYVRADFLYDHYYEDVVVLEEHFFEDDGRQRLRVRPRTDRNDQEFATRARARVNLDSRTQTDIGMIRTFTDLWFTIGPPGTDDVDIVSGSGATGTGLLLREAFIQIANDWGTATFGRAASFFEFWESDAWATRIGEDAPISPVNLAAATFNLGGGVSTTISLEDTFTDPDQRRAGAGGGLFPIDTNQDGVPDAVGVVSTFPGGLGVRPAGDAFGFDNRTGIHGGNRAPDLVGNLRVDQAWGSAQVMGALHPVRARAGTGPARDLDAGLSRDMEPDTEIGWAVGAGAGLEIPGTGISFNIQGVYADGAPGKATTGGDGFITDGVVVGHFDEEGRLIGTDLQTTEAWSVKAGLGGNLAPDWVWNLQGSFARVDLPEALGGPRIHGGAAPGAGQFFSAGPTAVQTVVFTEEGFVPGPVISSDYDYWTASGHVAWAPVRGFIAGVELAYERLEFDAGPEVDRWGGMVRVQKSF